jgi:hypothetical protein
MLAKILTFEIGWFDHGDNTSGAICSRLSKDANIVKVQAQTNTIYVYVLMFNVCVTILRGESYMFIMLVL